MFLFLFHQELSNCTCKPRSRLSEKLFYSYKFCEIPYFYGTLVKKKNNYTKIRSTLISEESKHLLKFAVYHHFYHCKCTCIRAVLKPRFK